MALPDSYTVKYGSLGAYFDAIQEAQPPERFSVKFLQNLEFKSTNDRTFIGILKELGFLDSNGVPTKRYFEYLDKTIADKVLAEGIEEMYSDLFAIKKDANTMSADDVQNKLKTLYAGKKKDNVIKLIAKTFVGLCELADFSPRDSKPKTETSKATPAKKEEPKTQQKNAVNAATVGLDSLQYHINIVLPDTRDQAVYDAIFKSLREHLG
ncbi:DUF5343 domain-containing protein [bacterium]|nr:DUF5343 domain-containing protein [Balneola sp.]MBR9917819.1 DUF5343 domain-containing protein [bacterium]